MRKTEATLIMAYDCEDRGVPQSIFVFHAVHKIDLDLEQAVKYAFSEWHGTKAGRFYVSGNGSNWGDAIEIPSFILKYHGIKSLRQPNRDKHGKFRVAYDHACIVDHNANLLGE